MALIHAVRWDRCVDLAGPFLVRYGRPEEAPPVVEDGGVLWEPANVLEREVLLGVWPFRRVRKVLVVSYRPVYQQTPPEAVTTPKED